MKHLIKTALYLLALIIPATALAHDFEVDGIYYNINGTTATVTTGTDFYTGDINIPDTVTYSGTTYPVTTIGDGAFAWSGARVNIPNSVTTIGNGAFMGTAPNNIPNSVTTIGDVAFYRSPISTIDIPNSVISLGSGVFSSCRSLTNINIPNSVTYIGDGAFEFCDNLSNISVASDNPKYDSRNNCNAIIETATNTLIAGCYNSFIPSSVNSIGNGAFNGCSGLTTINIPNSVTTIGDGAFSGCSNLTNINIPNSVTAIGKYAFSYCSGLTTINIGNSVTTIGDGAFKFYSSLLNSVYCYAVTPPERIVSNDYSIFSNYSVTLHVPAASLAAYFTAPEWSKFETIIGDAVAPTGIAFSKDSVELAFGQELHLTATVTPTNASYKEVTWCSTDPSIATVKNGTVTPVGCGECDIIVFCFGMQAVCHISVTNRISLEQQEVMLLPNHIISLTPSAPTMLSSFTATSSDPTVAAARVMNGKVQIVGIKEGTTTITVALSDGTAQPATCLVTVYTELGDANCDGFLNISDLTLLIDYLMNNETTTIKEANADLNGDGNINIADVTALIDHLLTTTD